MQIVLCGHHGQFLKWDTIKNPNTWLCSAIKLRFVTCCNACFASGAKAVTAKHDTIKHQVAAFIFNIFLMQAIVSVCTYPRPEGTGGWIKTDPRLLLGIPTHHANVNWPSAAGGGCSRCRRGGGRASSCGAIMLLDTAAGGCSHRGRPEASAAVASKLVALLITRHNGAPPKRRRGGATQVRGVRVRQRGTSHRTRWWPDRRGARARGSRRVRKMQEPLNATQSAWGTGGRSARRMTVVRLRQKPALRRGLLNSSMQVPEEPAAPGSWSTV